MIHECEKVRWSTRSSECKKWGVKKIGSVQNAECTIRKNLDIDNRPGEKFIRIIND